MQIATAAPTSVSHLVIDVETANRNRRSLCQIAVITVMTDGSKERFGVYVDPREPFEFTHIHGITAKQVAGSPTFQEVYAQIAEKVRGRIVVTHSDFDPQAFRAACMHHGLPGLECRWVDSVDLARAAWPHFPNHKLKTLCQKLRIPLNHHDAVSDAYATAVMVDKALEQTRTHIAAWTPSPRKGEGTPLARPGAPGMPFSGKRVVFTGSFLLETESLAREAAAAGYEVQNSVTKKTDVLVQGVQHADLAARYPKSAKTLKAEELRAGGHAIDILTESAFRVQIARAGACEVAGHGLDDVMDLDAYVAAHKGRPEARALDTTPPLVRPMESRDSQHHDKAEPARPLPPEAPVDAYAPATVWQDFFLYTGALPRGSWGKKFLISWAFLLLSVLAGALLSHAFAGLGDGQQVLFMVGPSMIVFFGYMVPLCIRRSRDIGMPAWLGAAVFLAAHLVPFVPFVYYAVLLAIPGRKRHAASHFAPSTRTA